MPLTFDHHTPFSLALVLSLALHAAIAGALRRSGEVRAAPEPERLDNWSANSVEVGVAEEAELQRAQPAPEPASAPAPAPAPEREPAAVTAPPIVLPRPRAHQPASHAERAVVPQLAKGANSARAPDSSASSEASASPGAAAGSFGALGLPAGTRHFGAAFARALPAATYADARWSELAPGALGHVLVDVTIDADGHLAELELAPDQTVPPVLATMIEHARLLLKSGVFSLDPSKTSAGSERWSIDVAISDVAANPDADAKPGDLFALGHQSPTRDRPGYARFTLNSGRHVEAALKLLPAR